MRKIITVLVLMLGFNLVFAAVVDTTTLETKTTYIWFQNNEVISNEIKCLPGTYKGAWNGHSIVLEIVDARYNNILSFKGSISGYVQYNNKVYPVKGTLRYKTIEHKYEVNISMVEYDAKNKISFDVNGYITCYKDGTGKFEGAVITPGYNHPEMYDITLRKNAL